MKANTRTQTLRLRADALDRLVSRALYGSDEFVPALETLADHLGLSISTMSRIRNGLQRPGHDFIAAVRAAFPGVPFEDLFELVEEGEAA